MPASDQGITKNRYSLIPRTLLFLFHKNNVLMIKGAADKRLWANMYNGIGGHVEHGEDIFASAQRELVEETGLIADELWLCGVITVDPGGDTGVCIFVFKGMCQGGTPVPSREGILEWVPVNEVNHYPMVEDLYTLMPYITKAQRVTPPFIGRYWYDASGRLMIHITGDR